MAAERRSTEVLKMIGKIEVSEVLTFHSGRGSSERRRCVYDVEVG